ncbi:MAG: DUF1059 domain-containing protein [Thermodesulfovibrionales bacterium]
MAEKLYSIECDPKCGFIIKSHDKEEVIEIAKRHGKEKHKMDITDKDIEAMIKVTID